MIVFETARLAVRNYTKITVPTCTMSGAVIGRNKMPIEKELTEPVNLCQDNGRLHPKRRRLEQKTPTHLQSQRTLAA